jgi:hypothetical protein
MSFLAFTMMPMWVSICVGWVNLACTSTTVIILKFLGAASKHYRYTGPDSRIMQTKNPPQKIVCASCRVVRENQEAESAMHVS